MLNKLKLRLRALFHQAEMERELDEELRFHLEKEIEQNLARGMNSEEARYAALRSFGGIEQVKEASRDVRGVRCLEDLWQDLRYGTRLLLKQKGFTAVTVLTLALGIGANTAIFSVVNTVLLRPLPYPEPERLMTFWLTSPAEGLRKLQWTEGLYAFLRDRSHMFDGLAAYSGSGFNAASKGEPERLWGATVTHDFFRVLGQQPIYGRTFFPQEERPGRNDVVILSYQLWQRRFGGDPAIVGQAIKLDNVSAVIIGIMPPRFDFPDRAELWVPLPPDPQNPDGRWYLNPIARLKPNVTAADAGREMGALLSDYAQQQKWPKGPQDSTMLARPLQQEIVGDARTPLLVLLGAVGLVLLIACANIANLLLARATMRRREIAVRCCLGASRWRIITQLLIESLLLSLIGASCGLLLAAWGVDGIKRLSAEIPRLESIRLDLPVLLFTIAVALLTGLLCGLAPALHATHINLQEALKEGARSSASASSRRVHNAFVIAQIALSLVLLISAGLLLQSFRHLLAVNPGFRPENVLTAGLQLPDNKYTNDAQVRRFYEQLLERLQHLPGVRVAGLCQQLPFNGVSDATGFTIEGREPGPSEPLPVAWWRDATPDYFAAMSIPIIKGRPFQQTDTSTSLPVAIVDERFARTHWPHEDPIGKHIRWGRAAWGNPLMTVVGVVGNVKQASLDEDDIWSGYVYMPVAQMVSSRMLLVIHTADKPEALIPAVRREVLALDPELPLFEISTLEQAIARSLSTKRLTSLLLAGFAATALLLAVIGIYGVISLNVSNRTSEFGIRLALGAQPRDVLRLVIGQGLRLTFGGVALGLGGALGLTRFLASLLFEIKPTDPLIFTGVAVALALAALAACYVPARRATKVDPLIALRYE